MRYKLEVPFKEKDNAKKLGAKWNSKEKFWFIDNPKSLEKFHIWSPIELAKPTQKVIISDFVAQNFLTADELPWKSDEELIAIGLLNNPNRIPPLSN